MLNVLGQRVLYYLGIGVHNCSDCEAAGMHCTGKNITSEARFECITIYSNIWRVCGLILTSLLVDRGESTSEILLIHVPNLIIKLRH